MSNKQRIQQLEKRRDSGQLQNTRPQIVEIWGTREDGTRYLIETWKQLVNADKAGHLDNCPQWQAFTDTDKE